MMTTVDESELRSFLHEHTPKWITEQEASLRVIAFPLTSELHERLAPFFGDTLADARISSVPMSSPAWYSDLLGRRSEEHTSELQSLRHLVCRLLLEKKKI